tara:strand:+ start:1266 stop:3281 length:2016 start_codon:yes stop_codon:yes gene_type:complete
MRYQNPEILYALFAIAIPIIIHLLNLQKHKKLYFSSIRFLKEIQQNKKSNLRLKNILILISRILAITFLILAFAKPYISYNNKESDNIFIYVDNSFSMDGKNTQGRALDIAKEKARIISQSYNINDNLYLITNDFLPIHEYKYNKETIEEQINNIKTSSNYKNINEIIKYSKSIKKGTDNHLYIISDIQKSTLKFDSIKPYNTKLHIVPIEYKINNISIDSCWSQNLFTNIEEEEIKIFLKIKNHSDKENITNQVIFLYINGKQKSQQFINLAKKESKEIAFNFRHDEKYINGQFMIHDTPITFDNNLYFTIKRIENINVCSINDRGVNNAINTLFKNDSLLFNFINYNINNINYNIVNDQDLLILNQVKEISSGLVNSINKIHNNGGSVLIIPPNDSNLNIKKYNIMLDKLEVNKIRKIETKKLKINNINTQHHIFKNVFNSTINKIEFPSVKKYNITTKDILNTPILRLENQHDLLTAYAIKKGITYQLNSPLIREQNTLIEHALFVPLLINIAAKAVRNRPLYNILNKNKFFKLDYQPSESIINIRNNEIDIIPTIKNIGGVNYYNTNNQIKNAGKYKLIEKDSIVDYIAFNYNRIESNIKTINTKTIKKIIKEKNIKNINVLSNNNLKLFQKSITNDNTRKEYWKILLILSIIFFAIEILLIKLIKK